jgi:hypothetical protein
MRPVKTEKREEELLNHKVMMPEDNNKLRVVARTSKFKTALISASHSVIRPCVHFDPDPCE